MIATLDNLKIDSFRAFKDARLFPGGAEEWDWGATGTRHNPGIQIADLSDLLVMKPDVGATSS